MTAIAIRAGMLLFAAAVFGVAAAQDLKVIVGAALFDGTGREPLRDAVIVIEGSRIREAGTRSRGTIAEDAHRIEATGKFVIPGLSDMHNHLGTGTFESSAQPAYAKHLQTLLAWGHCLRPVCGEF